VVYNISRCSISIRHRGRNFGHFSRLSTRERNQSVQMRHLLPVGRINSTQLSLFFRGHPSSLTSPETLPESMRGIDPNGFHVLAWERSDQAVYLGSGPEWPKTPGGMREVGRGKDCIRMDTWFTAEHSKTGVIYEVHV
jgi:hypothetical protein